jgi:hypothetical protein
MLSRLIMAALLCLLPLGALAQTPEDDRGVPLR